MDKNLELINIEGLSKGDETAIRDMFVFLLPMLTKRVFRELNRDKTSSLDADDVIQNTFLSILTMLDRYFSGNYSNNKEDFIDYLLQYGYMTITHYVVRERTKTFDHTNKLKEIYEETSKSRLNLIDYEMLFNEINNCLKKRPVGDRRLIQNLLEGKSFEEIAISQNTSVASIYFRYMRLKHFLIGQLKLNNLDDSL